MIHEKIQRTFELMVKDLEEDNVVMVAYYIRPKHSKDVDAMIEETRQWYSRYWWWFYDLVAFEKYLKETMFTE